MPSHTVKRILLALGGTPFSEVALRWAVDLAVACGARVTALTVLDRELWRSSLHAAMSAAEAAQVAESRLWEATRERVEQLVEAFLSACARAGVEGDIHTNGSQPFDEIYARGRHHDLLVFGLRGLFDYTLVPEPEQVIARLIERGVRPILAVPKEHRPVRRVLIAYSGSAESANTMRQFAQYCLWPAAEVRLACFGRPAAEADPLLADAAAYLESHGYAPIPESIPRSPMSALLPYAEESGCDLIVLGDSYRNILVSSLLGDIMRHVTRFSTIPLFLSH